MVSILPHAVMINTYTTTCTVPPVPTRSSSRTEAPSHTPYVLFLLLAVMVLQMIISVGGFVYLFHKDNELQSEFEAKYHDDIIVLRTLQNCDDSTWDHTTLLDCQKILDKYRSILSKISETEGQALRRGGVPFRDSAAVAHMLVKPHSSLSKDTKVLQWNRDHSVLMNVAYMSKFSTLRVTLKGEYYVYSQVTFSKWHPVVPLAQTIVRRSTSADKITKEDILLKAFCGMKGSGEVCTSFQGGVFQLDEGAELFVNVTDISLINFEETATTFGLFML